ncbi:DUF2813 domain-containing protein [Deinococcus sp. KSM4-11]|uniref:ATP-dependent nuclease n=1 Tax=Deinococcus sp. KSM4-11 TaxID=2568654 RepID=UPI0010A43910|nr:ATP-binding protein [Deinococcus sp. KSM4-11]THF84935.1 DUF2813 domain-containing protein [Deinococcus sp. KSM4-11]
MIKKLTIKNFKGIEALSIELQSLNILIGSNNSGKTSIMQAVHMSTALMQSIELTDRLKKIPASASASTSTISPNQILYTPFEDIEYFAHNGNLTQTSGFEVGFEFSNSTVLTIGVKKGKNKNLVVSHNNLIRARELADIDHPFSIFVPGLAGISKNEQLESLGVIRRALARGDANLVFRNVLFKLNSDKIAWQSFQDSLKLIFPDHNIKFKFDENIDEHIEVYVERPNGKLPIDAMGTGFLQVTQILSYSYLFKPKVLLLDEPDSHVHPDNQRRISKFLESVDIQTIVSTHSRHILDAATKNTKKIWIKNGEALIFTDNLDILLDLGAIDSAEGLLSNKGIKYIIFTEDSDTSFLKTLLSSHIESEVFSIWSYKGSSRIDTAIAMAKVIHSISKTVKVILHRDRDCLSPEYFDDQSKRLKNNSIDLFVTKGSDIESYFTLEDYLKSINIGNESDVLNSIHNVNSSDAKIDEMRQIYRRKLDDARG